MLFEVRAELERHVNTLWDRWAKGLRPVDGFQVDIVRIHPFTERILFRATIYGGASFVGEPEEVRLACREHVRRVGRRGRRVDVERQTAQD